MKKHTIAILAFNSHDLTMKVVDQTFKNNPESDILIFDNGSEPSFKKLINKYSNEIHYYREKENIYVNFGKEDLIYFDPICKNFFK